MTRAKRTYYQNATYHVCVRGNNKQDIIREDDDKLEFLKTVSKFKSRFNFKLFGFVLMDNHAHLVVSINESTTISKVMQAIELSFSRKFRKKYNYTGYVWQGRFKSTVMEDERYVFACLEYIHHNPVRAGIVKHPAGYAWSSYRSYSGDQDLLNEYIQIDKLVV